MAYQKKQPPPRRFFEYLQQRIGSIAVHLLSAVDDDDEPPLLRLGQSKEAGNLARILDDNLAAQASPSWIIGSLDRQQVGMSPRSDTAKDAACRIGSEAAIGRAAGYFRRNIRRFH